MTDRDHPTTRHYSEYGFADSDNARRYAAGSPSHFLPAMEVMQKLTAQLLAETTPTNGRVLVLGAGGGLELSTFAKLEPNWRFTAVDPSSEMIEAGKENLAHAAERIEWVEAYIPDSPRGPFDSATCLLTLHIIADNGEKLKALQAIHQRLKPGGALVVVDNTCQRGTPDFDKHLGRFIEHARRDGVDDDLLQMVRKSNTEKGESVNEKRDVELFQQAGFVEIDLFFAALSWRGWAMKRP